MDVSKIKEIIPHRYPFLLVDCIEEMKENEVLAIKNVTVNEPFFQGHFPQNPVMPGVLLTETMVQAGVFYMLSKEEFSGKIAYLTDIERAKFRKSAVPGDVLHISVQLIRIKDNVAKLSGKILIHDKMCANAIFTLFIQ